MRLIRFADLAPAPWKNGRGETREYAVHPPGAGLDDFYWRISRARVANHTTFSVFPGIDRTLTLVAGPVIDLLLPDRRVRLDRATPPFRFKGDVSLECRVPNGPIDDLNVMTRRSHWRHRVDRLTLAEPTRVALDGDVGFVVALDPIRIGDETFAPGDAAQFDTAAEVEVHPGAPAAALLRIVLEHTARRRA